MIKLRQSATRPLNFGSAVETTATSPVLGRRLRDLLFILLTTTGLSGTVVAQEAPLGADLPGLLAHARARIVGNLLGAGGHCRVADSEVDETDSGDIDARQQPIINELLADTQGDLAWWLSRDLGHGHGTIALEIGEIRAV